MAHGGKHRSDELKEINLVLEENDPLKRLSELCDKGKYKYRFTWDKFKNGIMCTCEIYYFINKNKRIVISKSSWISTHRLNEAQSYTASVVLSALKFGPEDTSVSFGHYPSLIPKPCSKPSEPWPKPNSKPCLPKSDGEKIVSAGMKLMTEFLSLSDIDKNKPWHEM